MMPPIVPLSENTIKRKRQESRLCAPLPVAFSRQNNEKEINILLRNRSREAPYTNIVSARDRFWIYTLTYQNWRLKNGGKNIFFFILNHIFVKKNFQNIFVLYTEN